MNKNKLLITTGVLIALFAGIGLYAADHIDAPTVTDTSSDITDLYVFRSPSNTDNLVFNVNTQGLLSPFATQNASFDPNVMVEINIDSNGDMIEDEVIQVIFNEERVFSYGPAAPQMTGLTSRVNFNTTKVSTNITEAGEDPSVGSNSGIRLFAGPRDDPFFFDFEQFNKILAGDASGFRDPGVDTFAGTNVLAIVVEVPKSMLPSAETLNVWATTNIRSN